MVLILNRPALCSEVIAPSISNFWLSFYLGWTLSLVLGFLGFCPIRTGHRRKNKAVERMTQPGYRPQVSSSRHQTSLNHDQRKGVAPLRLLGTLKSEW